jgi:type IV pilus assembly protein PilB
MVGQLLIKTNLLTEDQLTKAIDAQKTSGERLTSAIVKMGFVKEEALIAFLSKQYNAPVVDLSKYKIDTTLLKLVQYEKAKKLMLIPISKDGASLRIAVADPSNKAAIDDVQFITKMKVSVHVAAESQINKAIAEYYPKADQQKVALDGKKPDANKQTLGMDEINKIVGKVAQNVTVVETKDDRVSLRDSEAAPIIQLVNGILLNAVSDRASDIHIEPAEHDLRVRYRVDGVLKQVMQLPKAITNPLVSRLKIMSRLDISERRIPQDGRIKLKYGDTGEIDYRVSVLPCIFGEKVVMRLLDKSNLQLDLAKLGFEQQQLTDFLEAMEKPYGMLLVTGPTGSGKTTTLYSGLSHVNKPGVNIMTAEDPVEYNLPGINQVQIKADVGLTFAAALRSFLRQDPDIIMVGEIRDFETAEIGVKAALTGHFVLSTLHTNDAPSTITRLLNMGIEPFLVTSAVILVIAQRLARKICPNCKDEHKTSETALLKVGFTPEEASTIKTYMGMGCETCGQSGYKGRLALYEIMPVKAELKDLILDGASSEDIKREAVRLGMSTLRRSGLTKVAQGVTTIDEVMRVTFAD